MLSHRIPTIRFAFAAGSGIAAAEPRHYRVAGVTLQSDIPIGCLDAFEIESARGDFDGFRKKADSGPVITTHSARGWLVNERRQVVNHVTAAFFCLEVEGIGSFRVDRATGDITCLQIDSGLPGDSVEEALLGPPMMLALASHDIWCLHASAVSSGGRASLFSGDSGSGKSTLAARLGGTGTQTARLTDDISPFRILDDQAYLLPHFPQLKWGDRQFGLDHSGKVPSRSIFVLEPAGPEEEVALEPLPLPNAVKILAGQTVAVKLFDHETHARHLKFLSDLLTGVRVQKLKYPHNYRSIGQVSDILSSV